MSTKTLKKTKVIQTRLDADLVDQANEILDYIGLSTTDVVRVLLKNIVNTGSVPLEMAKPQKIEVPKNPPVLKLSPQKTAKIEQMLDDYYAGKLKTTRVGNKQELKDFLHKLSN